MSLQILRNPGVRTGKIQTGRRLASQRERQRLARLKAVFLQLAQKQAVSQEMKPFELWKRGQSFREQIDLFGSDFHLFPGEGGQAGQQRLKEIF